MKQLLDWQSKAVVQIFDEVNLWAAPFGRLLLENMLMKKGATVLDIGFGTGFPLIELSQRFGEQSKIYGVDIWEEGTRRAREKIKVLEINNIEILEESAAKISLADEKIDLITSNLGVNNFEEKPKVYAEIKRVLKKGGNLCITTNPIGTFDELFQLFVSLFEEMKWEMELDNINNYIKHRSTKESIVEEFSRYDLKLVKSKSDTTHMRFVDAEALLNHSLIRIGFRAYWENMIQKEKRKDFFDNLVTRINGLIKKEGEFKMTIPMLYLEFERK